MKWMYFLVTVLVAVSLACSQQISTPVPTVETTATRFFTASTPSIATRQWTATVSRAQINVRAEPDGEVIGNLQSGDTVTIVRCTTEWCKVIEPAGAEWKQASGWVWRGCLSDNPNHLGCTMREE